MKYSSRGFLRFHFHKIATESFYKTSKLREVHDYNYFHACFQRKFCPVNKRVHTVIPCFSLDVLCTIGVSKY